MKFSKMLPLLLTLALLCGCGGTEGAQTQEPAAPTVSLAERYLDARILSFESTENADGSFSHSAALDGEAVEEFDYVWHADPSAAHDAVKNCPAEYYTGTAPETDAAVYIAHDVFYYPALDESEFRQVNYDGQTEWAYYYTAESYSEYIFATLPVQGGTVPAQMMHSEAEAYDNAVLHITQAGTYVLSGTWHGQILIDLGDPDDTFADEHAKVSLILCGTEVTCTVAPALVFYSVYECDNGWEDRAEYTCTVDTSDAGANVILADGTENSFTGANVYRMLKAKYKNEDDASAVPVQKKARKTDGAFYSYVSMNICGESAGSGVLNVISSTYEGLDTELHLTINGGNINIFSQDDGVNVNEDGVSVVTVNGGTLHILAGLGSEGDGIDSNGFLVINGGTVISAASPMADSGMDSDCGTYVNGGTVLALGSAMDWAEAESGAAAGQAAMNLRFSGRQNSDESIIVTDEAGTVVFAYDPDKDEVAGSNARFYEGAILSAPGISVGGEYLVYVGGDVTGEETGGVYDSGTVTGFSTQTKMQGYGSAENLAGRMGPGGQRTEGMEPPDGFDPGQLPAPGEAPPARPGEGMASPDGMGGPPPEGFGGREGMTPPDDTFFGGEAGGELQTVFAMTGKVNGFSGVRDAEK